MNRLIRRYFIIFLILFAAVPLSCSKQNVGAETFDRTEIESTLGPLLHAQTDEQKFGILAWIKSNVPNLFEDAARYDIELFKLIEDQIRLVQELSHDKRFAKLMAEKKELATIRVLDNAKVRITWDVNPSSVEEIKTELMSSLRSLRESKDVGAAIKANLTQAWRELNGRSSAGLMTGLIQCCVDPSKKAEIFKAASFEEKLKILSRELPAKLPETFQNAPHKLTSPVESEAALDLLAKLKSAESRFVEYSTLAAVLQTPQGEIEKSFDAAYKKILQTDARDLSALAEKTTLAERLSAYLGKTEFSARDMAERAHAQLKPSLIKKELATEVLSLKEMPATIAIARGCTGGDCSTQYSFPYPNDPHERVFFIYDADGTLKGYVSTTTVLQDGKKSLFVITIAGSRISAADTLTIFDGLNAAKAELHVEQVLVPTKDRISGLINYEPIKSVMKEIAENGQEKPITYQNKEIRSKIEKFESEYHRADYDKIETNKTAVVYKPSKNSTPGNVGVHFEKRPMVFPKYEKITPQLVFDFAFDLYSSGRKEDLKKVLSISKIPETEFLEFVELAENREKLSVEKFFARLEHAANKMGVSVADLKKNPKKLFEGIFRAPDFATSESRPAIIKFLLTELKEEDGPSKKVERLIEELPEKLRSQKEITDYYHKIVFEPGDRKVPYTEYFLTVDDINKVMHSYAKGSAKNIAIQGVLILPPDPKILIKALGLCASGASDFCDALSQNKKYFQIEEVKKYVTKVMDIRSPSQLKLLRILYRRDILETPTTNNIPLLKKLIDALQREGKAEIKLIELAIHKADKEVLDIVCDAAEKTRNIDYLRYASTSKEDLQGARVQAMWKKLALANDVDASYELLRHIRFLNAENREILKTKVLHSVRTAVFEEDLWMDAFFSRCDNCEDEKFGLILFDEIEKSTKLPNRNFRNAISDLLRWDSQKITQKILESRNQNAVDAVKESLYRFKFKTTAELKAFVHFIGDVTLDEDETSDFLKTLRNTEIENLPEKEKAIWEALKTESTAIYFYNGADWREKSKTDAERLKKRVAGLTSIYGENTAHAAAPDIHKAPQAGNCRDSLNALL